MCFKHHHCVSNLSSFEHHCMSHFSEFCDYRLRGSRNRCSLSGGIGTCRRARYLGFQSKAVWLELLRSFQMNEFSQFRTVCSLHVIFYDRLLSLNVQMGLSIWRFICSIKVIDIYGFACFEFLIRWYYVFMFASLHKLFFKWVAPLCACCVIFRRLFHVLIILFLFVNWDRALSSQSPYKTKLRIHWSS